MNKKLIIGIIATLILSMLYISTLNVLAQETYINESILNIKAIVINMQYENDIDENTSLYLLDTNYFIKVSGNPTYTFNTREIVPTYLNTNQLNNVNKTIRTSIKDYSKNKWNWTLTNDKILFQPFVRGDNIN